MPACPKVGGNTVQKDRTYMNRSLLGEAIIVPSLRYRNGPAAVEWLCAAFGFEKHLVVPDPEGKIAPAQLILSQQHDYARIGLRQF